MTSRIASILLVILAIGLQSCTPSKEITYSLKDVTHEDSTNATITVTKNITLDIEPFEDIRETIPENGILFVRERETTINDKDYCINAEEHYERGTVADQVAKIMTEHFRKRGTFKDVVAKNRDVADYSLTGKLRRLYGEQEVSTGAKVGSMFGLIGALATIGAKTNGRIVFEFTDLIVHRKSDGKEKRVEDFSETFSGEMDADAYCWSIYENVNSQLKTAIGKLAISVASAVAECETATP